MPFLSQQPALNASLPISEANVTNLTADLAGKTAKATLTTKGDIYAASAASTPARVAVGADATVLTADAASTAGVKWAAPGGGSQTQRVVRKTINYNDAGILTGILVATIAAGEIIKSYHLAEPLIYIPIAWNGTTPVGRFLFDNNQGDSYAGAGTPIDMTQADAQVIGASPGHADLYVPSVLYDQVGTFTGSDYSCEARGGSVDVLFFVDDGSGGDPGASAGQAKLVLTILTAP